MNTVITKTELETLELGKKFAQELRSGDIVFLWGDLGFGKTTFTKGVAKGLGISNRIISPTFPIIRSYKNLYHIDLYRIENSKELEEIGIQEILSDHSSIKLIEWPERFANTQKRNWDVKIGIEKEQNNRTITYTHHE